MQHSAVQSPPFGYLSPPIDGCDALSEDGDTLQTPLTGHPEPYQPYETHHQSKRTFSRSYSSDGHDLQRHGTSEQQECSQHNSLLALHQPDRLGSSLSFVDTYFSSLTAPAQALDLANASLEYNPFAASFGSAFEAGSFYTTDSQPFSAGQNGFEYPPQLNYPEGPPLGHGPADDNLSVVPSLSVSMDSFDSPLGDLEQADSLPSLLLEPEHLEPSSTFSRPALRSTASENVLMTKARMFSLRFPADHHLNPFFAGTYTLGDELGAGGYGFVMTARHRMEGYEVAVKFIIKSKVPDHAWWHDELLGQVPTEVMIMSLVNHDNIVRCVDLFEDELYFYLVQELHGTPWMSRKRTKEKQITAPGKLVVPSPSLSTPCLTPSPSMDLVDSLLGTPPQVEVSVHPDDTNNACPGDSDCGLPESMSFVGVQHGASALPGSGPCITPSDLVVQPIEADIADVNLLTEEPLPPSNEAQGFLKPPSPAARPNFSRRPSYDLFECIEQSKHKRLSENNARYVFAQVVEAVYYLETQGITHCDIKDENLVIDAEFKVKLIDFGSAVVADPTSPRPYYTLFYGTTAYASSEILRKKPYQAPPAEIWTLGVLLSYLLTGHSPFPTEQDAIDGRMVVREMRGGSTKLSRAALGLMTRCLERDPERRADIAEVRGHRWLQGALERDRCDGPGGEAA